MLLSAACLARFEVGGSDESETASTDTGGGSGSAESGDAEGGASETTGEGETGEGCDACDPLLEMCEGGSCVCRSGLTPCGGMCVDLESDPANCGSCGSACAGGSCEDGDCQAMGCLEESSSDCAGACVNLENDPLHCGACSTTCMSDELCVESECVGYEPGSCRSDLDCRTGVCCEVENLDKVCLDGGQCP